MVVGFGIMPPSRLPSANTDDYPAGDDEEDEREGTSKKGDLPPAYLDLPRLLATARHGDVSTLPPGQRHLLSKILWARGLLPKLALQDPEAIKRYNHILHRNQRRKRQESSRREGCHQGSDSQGFKQPKVPDHSQASKQPEVPPDRQEFKEPKVPLHSPGFEQPQASIRVRKKMWLLQGQEEKPELADSSSSSSSSILRTNSNPHLRIRSRSAELAHRHKQKMATSVRPGGNQISQDVLVKQNLPDSLKEEFGEDHLDGQEGGSHFEIEKRANETSSEEEADSQKLVPKNFPPAKRLCLGEQKWVPVSLSPPVHPSALQGHCFSMSSLSSPSTSSTSYPSCSSSSSSKAQSSQAKEYEWRPVRVTHLARLHQSLPRKSSSSSSNPSLPLGCKDSMNSTKKCTGVRSIGVHCTHEKMTSNKRRIILEGGSKFSRSFSSTSSSFKGSSSCIPSRGSFCSWSSRKKRLESQKASGSPRISVRSSASLVSRSFSSVSPSGPMVTSSVHKSDCLTPSTLPQGAPLPSGGSKGESTASAPSLKYHWMNQLTKIFLQEVPDEGKEAETAEASDAASTTSTSTSSSSASSTSSVPSAGSSASSSTDSGANLSTNTKSSSATTSSSSSLSGTPSSASSLPSTGMGNPFARASTQATWGQSSESHDHKRILAPSKLGPQPDTGMKVTPGGGSSILRQSSLGSVRSTGPLKSSPSSLFTSPTLTVTGSSPPQPSRSAFKLKPSVLAANPFSKSLSNAEKAEAVSGSEDLSCRTSGESSSGNVDVSSSSSVSTALPTSASSLDRDHSLSADSRTSSSNSNSNITNSSSPRNMFVPLSRNGDGSDGPLSPSIRNSGTIFGHNLISKVTGAESSVTSSSDAASATTNGERQASNLFSEASSAISRSPDSAAATNGRIGGTGNLFSLAASEILGTEDNTWNSGPSLAETSRELTEKENSQKRKFDQVEVITGEESESNVLQMNCKLYAWVCGSWQERGRGILRLNDWDAGKEIHSRLVIRTQGTLTVMLNTKVWAEMSVERASNKSVRFTALDADGQPKIFLAMGSPKDIDLLYNSLEWRVAASRSQTQEEGSPDSSKKAKKEEAGASALTR